MNQLSEYILMLDMDPAGCRVHPCRHMKRYLLFPVTLCSGWLYCPVKSHLPPWLSRLNGQVPSYKPAGCELQRDPWLKLDTFAAVFIPHNVFGMDLPSDARRSIPMPAIAISISDPQITSSCVARRSSSPAKPVALAVDGCYLEAERGVGTKGRSPPILQHQKHAFPPILLCNVQSVW
jgi:hypothetical protein